MLRVVALTEKDRPGRVLRASRTSVVFPVPEEPVMTKRAPLEGAGQLVKRRDIHGLVSR
jgi:hypothetical protein